ncbi:MAG: sulfotransferase [Cyanobacteriota bacterium]|nr:sulfotransferase [Cyanobacteriota bacterium]
MRRPNFFIVGAPKCGTTSLCHYLGQHPEIFIPPAKEIHYFGSDLTGNKKAKTEDEYLNFFQNRSQKYCGEGSTWYLFSQKAAREIAQFNPDSKIIVMLREPVSMLHSLHSQRLVNGSSENIFDFQKALEAEADRRLGRKMPKKCMRPEGLFYSDVVKFAEQIERYFEVFGRDRVRVIIFDDFQANTERVYRQTLKFLGARDNFRPNFDRLNANKRVRSAALQRFLRFPPSCLATLGKTLPLRSKCKQEWWTKFCQTARAWNTYAAARSSLDPDLYRSLQQRFAPEVERLSNLLGRDLSYWSREITVEREPASFRVPIPSFDDVSWPDWMSAPTFADFDRKYL